MKLNTFLLFSLISFSTYAQGFAPVANVMKIKGEAFINKEKIEVRAEVATEMEITMSKGGHIDIKFQNGHLVRFENAEVFVQTITPKEYFFTLKKGKAYSIVRPLTENEKFLIKTKDASFNVRGTKFIIEERSNDTSLIVTEGVVTAERENKMVEVRKGQTLNVSAKGKLKAVLTSKKIISENDKVFENMLKL